MKKLYTSFVFLISFFVLFSSLRAEIIDVSVVSNSFLPPTVNAEVGDQIRWTLLGGSHTTTSTDVPSGADTWDYTFSGFGDEYIYDVEIAGSYSYLCLFHGGMEGTITAVLPIELASFTAAIYEGKIKLLWSTVMEVNNSGFDIERKNSANNSWSKIGFVTGNGTTNKTQHYTFIDEAVNSGRYNYRLKQLDYNGNFEYFNLTEEISIGVPDKYFMSQNYPNPFNPITKIDYQLPYDGKVSLKIYDIMGREVAELFNGNQTAGNFTITFNAANIASGIYFYQIIAEGNGQTFTMTKRMILLK
jgi:plastocyanin